MIPETEPIVQQILDNILKACQAAQIQHIVGVATSGNSDTFTSKLQTCGIRSTV